MKKILKFLFFFSLISFAFNGEVLSQEEHSFDEFVKNNSWYISTTLEEKLQDSKNTFGVIKNKPESFEDIPFKLHQDDFQFFRIGESLEILVLKPMALIVAEYKNIGK